MSAFVSPHSCYGRSIAGRLKSCYGDKPNTLISVVVVWIAGLQIGRHMIGVDPGQVLLKKRDSKSLSSVFALGAKKAQIVVRFMSRVGATEPV